MGRKKGFYEKFIKRPQDCIMALIALVLLSPLFLILVVLVRLKLGDPIFFSQERPGLNEKVFKMYKFRTMTDEKDENGELLPDSVRLTRFGKLLRTTSLDELPELWNIICGDMAIVGPRPLLVQYLPLYNAEQRRRHEVRPGLSGLAQVNGRNTISWEEKFSLDIKYIDSLSFVNDWGIILLTIRTVLVRDGISSGTSVTMEPFGGSKESVK
jgi:undecaprenyl phosphate N,N'-diacetylbacillosamine 1-phosphate transferase